MSIVNAELDVSSQTSKTKVPKGGVSKRAFGVNGHWDFPVGGQLISSLADR